MNPNPANTNFFAALACNEDNDETTVTSNKFEDQVGTETVFQAVGINIPTDMEVANEWATGHFMLTGTPVKNLRPTTTPIKTNLPDG